MKFRIYSKDLEAALAAVNHGKKPIAERNDKFRDAIRGRCYFRAYNKALQIETCDADYDGRRYTATIQADIIEEGTGDADFYKLLSFAKSKKDDLVYETRPNAKNSRVDCGGTTIFMDRDSDTYEVFGCYSTGEDADFCEFCREDFERIVTAAKTLPQGPRPDAVENLIVSTSSGKKPKAVFTNGGAALALESTIPSTMNVFALVPTSICVLFLKSNWEFVAISSKCAKTDSGLSFRWNACSKDQLEYWASFVGMVDSLFAIDSEVYSASCENLHSATKSLKAFFKKGYEVKIFPDKRGLRILRYDGYPRENTPAAETIAPGECKPFKSYSLDLRLLMAGIPKAGTLRMYLDKENTALIRIDDDPLSSIVLPCSCAFENRDSIF